MTNTRPRGLRIWYIKVSLSHLELEYRSHIANFVVLLITSYKCHCKSYCPTLNRDYFVVFPSTFFLSSLMYPELSKFVDFRFLTGFLYNFLAGQSVLATLLLIQQILYFGEMSGFEPRDLPQQAGALTTQPPFSLFSHPSPYSTQHPSPF